MLRRVAQDCLCQVSAEHLQQCAEFLPLRNRGLGPLVVPVSPVPLTGRAAATLCAAVQSTAPLFRRWRPAGVGNDEKLDVTWPNSPAMTALLQMGGRIDGRGNAAIRSAPALSLIVLSP